MERSGVRDSEGMVWWWGEGKKSILKVPAQALSRRCLTGMTYYPKETS